MLKVIYIAFSISLFHNFAAAQWVQQTSGVSSSFADVQFLNTNTGWVCGANGTILKTTNSGLNWETQNSGVTETLYDLHAVDANTVYCVGIFETILRTTDGGNSWIIIRGNVNPGKFFYGSNFINANTGWICGGGQCVLRTTNGGNSFDSSFVPATFYSIYFKDSLNGLLAGEGGDVFKSTNGGVNWHQINVLGEAAEFFELTFIGDRGWIAGWQNRKVYRTTNFGESWDSIARIPGITNWSVSSLNFSSMNTGWACGGSGNLYKTTDGGYNWLKQAIPVFTAYSSVFFVNDTIGWCGGNTGTILHTTTGGQIVGVGSTQIVNRKDYNLEQNYPNPFNPKTTIKYHISSNNTKVKLSVYDLSGKEIAVLVKSKNNTGMYKVDFDGKNLASGTYFYVLEANEDRITKKMILIK